MNWYVLFGLLSLQLILLPHADSHLGPAGSLVATPRDPALQSIVAAVYFGRGPAARDRGALLLLEGGRFWWRPQGWRIFMAWETSVLWNVAYPEDP